MTAPWSRLRERRNTSASDNASWIVAIGILAVVIPASEKVAANEVFFAAHGVSPVAWVVLLFGGVAICWAVLAGLLRLVQRRASARTYDVVVSIAMLLVTWFFLGNVLTRTLLSSAPYLGPVVGLAGALVITALARDFRMGNILVVFAVIAAAVPLVGTVIGTKADTTAEQFTFTEVQDRPSIIWIISDELQYPLVFDQEGNVRPEFPNLQALAAGATTYSKAYSSANYTDYAVPSMLTGISDVAAVGVDKMQEVRAGIGIIPGLASEYSIVMQSPIYSFDCDTEECATVGTGDDVGAVARYWAFAKDTAAIAGRTALAPPFSNLFPSLDGKWRDFWSGGDEFGDNAQADSVDAMIRDVSQAVEAAPTSPVFGLWHSIRTHAPWVVDREGRQIYPSLTPIVEGAHLIGEEADQSYTSEDLKHLERRLWADSAVDFDRQLGKLIAALKAEGRYDDTMIVLTADHGATMTENSDRRVGDNLVQRWSEVAHVPMVVKAPGQASPEIVTDVRSTGQIAATVMQAAGATAGPDLALSPDLTQDLPDGPVFTTVAGGVLTPWRYQGIAEVDPWVQDDLTPPDPDHPYAVGIDTALIGKPAPAGWVEVPEVSVSTLPGESPQEVVIVDRASSACAVEDTVGLVTTGDRVIGSVLWEGPEGSSDDQTRGWAIVPRAEVDSYRFWCPARD